MAKDYIIRINVNYDIEFYELKFKKETYTF